MNVCSSNRTPYGHISLPYLTNFVLNANRQSSLLKYVKNKNKNKKLTLHILTYECTMSQYVECHLLILILILSLVECWCIHMPHCLGRPSGVDYTNGGDKRMISNSLVSHATLVLWYHASM